MNLSAFKWFENHFQSWIYLYCSVMNIQIYEYVYKQKSLCFE